ncbi:MAG TPA: hypothetical protein EYP62_07560 [Kiritimatiellae bacterium]|nr:hypothetical protein [Kiritimatiellia bacterium]
MGLRQWIRRLRGGEGKGDLSPAVWRGRAQQIAVLQAGYEEMLELARTVRSHLERQAQVQERLLGLLEELPASLQSVRQLGEGARRQTEVLERIDHNLQKSAQEDRRLADGLRRFGEVLQRMDSTSRGTARTVARLMARSHESEEMLRELVVRSERRVTMLVAALGIVAVLAAGSALLFFDRGGTREPGVFFGSSGRSMTEAGSERPGDAVVLDHSIAELEARRPLPSESEEGEDQGEAPGSGVAESSAAGEDNAD